jgi:type II secretion system protein H
MTLPIGHRKSNRGAFTLIELMLVMALLVIVVAITFPSLQGFFRGRTLDGEARRFLTLTRYAQSRAVAEGIPMTLWIDPIEGAYGLEAQKGFLDRDDKAVQYDMDQKLEFVVGQAAFSRAQLTQEQQLRRQRISASRNTTPEIRFAADGSIDVMSPRSVCIREDQDHAMWIVLSENRSGYEEQNEDPDRRR